MSDDLNEKDSAARAIEAARRELPEGTTARAKLQVVLREPDTRIDVPPAPRHRAITGLGLRYPTDVSHQRVMADVVLAVVVDKVGVWSAPLTHLPHTPDHGVRAIAPPIKIPPGAAARFELRAYCTLPASGVGFVLEADVLNAESK